MWDSRVTRQHWDLAIIHPMCTYLCNSGVRWLYEHPWRWKLMVAGAQFFKACLDDFPAERVAVENPIMHGHAVKIVGREADQTVQPHHFGDPFMKATCWWLKNLPKLKKTNPLEVPKDPVERRKWAEVHNASPGPERAKLRSTFYPGMSDACAAQWGTSAQTEHND